MLKTYLLGGSRIIRASRDLVRKLKYMDEYFNNCCKNSRIYYSLSKFFGKIRIFFRHSRLEWFSDAGCVADAKVIADSRLAGFCSAWLKSQRYSLSVYLSSSLAAAFIRGIWVDVYARPVRAGGIVVVSSVTTNTVLSVLLGKDISSFGWAIRGVLLFIAICGILCSADWPALKNASAFLRRRDKSVI